MGGVAICCQAAVHHGSRSDVIGSGAGPLVGIFMAPPPLDMSVSLFGYMVELSSRLDVRFATVVAPSPLRSHRHRIPFDTENRIHEVADATTSEANVIVIAKIETDGETQYCT